MNVAQMNRTDFFSMIARLFHRVVDRAISRSPADQENVAFFVAINFRQRNFLGEFAQFIATLRRHHHVQFRTARGVTHLVVFESGQKRIFAVENPRARGNMLSNRVDRVRLKSLAWREVRFRIDHQFRKIRFIERFDPRRQRSIAQNENRRAVLARDPGSFDCDVKTIFHRLSREHDTWAVAVSAIDRLMQIALLDVGRQSGARPTALNIANNERDLRHRGPADRFGLERNSRTSAASNSEIAGIRKPER